MEKSTRRDFIKNVAIGGTAAGMSLTAAGLSPRRIYAAETSGFNRIVYRQLGSTGEKVSEIGFGAMNMRDPELVHAAVDNGINYIDTANGYMKGVNEEVIGSVMKTKRDKVFLTTKLGGRNPDNLPEMLETSLKRLQTDHVDLLLLHNVRSSEQILDEDFMKFFDDARRKGYTRFVGFSTHNFPGEISDAAIKSEFWEAALVVYNYLSPPDVAESIKKARESGIAIIAMKNLLKMESGPPRERPAAGSSQPPRDSGPPRERPEAGNEPPRRQSRPRRESIGDIREDKTSKTTPQQALIKWVLNNPYVDTVIPGMTSFEQLADDLGVMGMKLTFDDRYMLKRYSENIKGRYCYGLSGCAGCKDKCPKGLEINEINRCLGYAYGYGDIGLAQENYHELSRSNRIDICADCEECAVKCANGLNLTDTIQRARELFA